MSKRATTRAYIRPINRTLDVDYGKPARCERTGCDNPPTHVYLYQFSHDPPARWRSYFLCATHAATAAKSNRDILINDHLTA